MDKRVESQSLCDLCRQGVLAYLFLKVAVSRILGVSMAEPEKGILIIYGSGPALITFAATAARNNAVSVPRVRLVRVD